MLSRFHLITERHGQTDRRTDRIAISIWHVSVLTRDKNSGNGGEVECLGVGDGARNLERVFRSCWEF